jgi:hypothetical protein
MTTLTEDRVATRRVTAVPVARDGSVRQGGMSVITAIIPGRTAQLRALLDSIDQDAARGTDVESNPLIPFTRLTRVHFARWLIFEEARDTRNRTIPATLIFNTNYDEPLYEHLEELIDVAGPGLDAIYRHCVDYPAGGCSDAGAAMTYLLEHRVPVNTFYNGTYGRSVAQIRREAFLREEIGEFVDERVAAGVTQSARAWHQSVRAFVGSRPDLSWALQPPMRTRPPFPWGPLRTVFGGVLIIAAIAAATPLTTLQTLLGAAGVALLVIGMWLLAVRMLEARDDATAWTEKHRAKTPQLDVREDRLVQNQLTSVINIKPGIVRALTIRTILAAINLAARHIFYRGKLGDISSIHFARWMIVDDGRRLAFFSNFDGSWESYLGDFVDRAAFGLTAIWSNCVAFPRTRWLVTGGAAHEQAFKSYARDTQVLTNVWYSAYKTLTVLNIISNSEVRRGLSATMTSEEVALWLRRL